ncbi:bifunctional nuclease family protein [Spirosoma sp. KNUC1025]|uniref:bifunctional nuclease family protein n=1 Tax=Spirosoma sp. KNUC1025 TaxID=2894082 RepID=UPI0038704BED|nr:bifunctional nuclease family protein [Spirosoma sp. KNUC1025]
MNNVELSIVGLSESVSKPGNYTLVLEEPISKRRIPMVIGPNEAQSIAIAMEKMQPFRPLTHDLFQQALTRLQTHLQWVFIKRLEGQVFYASIFLKSETSDEPIELDARPSDAIALAVRFNCPIYATQQVVDVSAYTVHTKQPNKKNPYADYTLEELEALLAEIITTEDYESAARVRDAIERRRSRKE